MKLLRKLVETPGIPGREERIRKVIHDEVKDLFDEIHTDAMGNLVCTRQPRSGEGKIVPKTRQVEATTVMLACHMDEIGFIVSHIEEKTGFLRVQNVGGFDTRTLIARRVLVQTAKGDMIGIMSASKPIHVMSDEEKKKIPDVSDVYVDLLTDAKTVCKQVRVGDPVTLWQPLVEVGDGYVCKAMDDRIASWVAINAVRKAAKKHSARIVYVATVQEEVGLRGAMSSVHSVKPDVGIAIDTTIAADTPGVSDSQRVTKWGGDVALKVMDSASITHRGLLDEWIKIAEKKKLTYQLEVLPRGGTDAGSLQRAAGPVKAGTISIPSRYVHTVCEAVNKNDLDAAVALLAEYLRTA